MILRSILKANTGRKVHVVKRLNSTVRKMAFPLIKALHPDMFVREDQIVQSSNIQCIQNLNSLWDCIDIVLQDMVDAKQQKRTNIDVKTVFRVEYVMDCFSRSVVAVPAKDNGSSEQSLVKHSFKIVTPDVFKSKCNISVDRAREELNKLLFQQGDLFVMLGLKDPWSPLRAKPLKSPIDITDDVDDGKDDAASQAEMETLLFESLQHHNMYGGGGVFLSSPVYRPPSTKGQHRPKGISFQDRASHQALRDTLEDNIDMWIRKGNVMLQNLKPEDEVPAVRNLRDFILRYSNVINFNLHVWGALMVVIEPPRAAPKPVHANKAAAPGRRRGSAVPVSKPTAAATEPVSNNSEPISASTELSSVIYSKHGFAHSKHNDAWRPIYVLRMPANFSEARLLDYMSDHIPITNPMMQAMQKVKPLPDSVFREAERAAAGFTAPPGVRRVF